MNELDLILEDCLRRIIAEGYSIGQCLERYPERRAELEPLLLAAMRVSRARAVVPSAAYKRIARAELMTYVGAHRPGSPRFLWPAWKLSVVAAACMVLLLFSTTAFAQAALPGGLLYSWKLGSEQVWRALAPDPVEVDLTLADRRTTELTDLKGDPSGQDEAREGYHEVLKRLEAEKDEANGPKIDQALQAHLKKLNAAGIQDKELDEMVHGKAHQGK